MADRIKIEGVPPYDGEYDLDVSAFTNRELHQIKKLTGLRIGEFEDALTSGDMDVIVGLTVVALQRAGKTVDPDAIWDAEMGAITLLAGADELPPAESPSEPPSETRTSSGGDSTPGSDSLETIPLATGTRG